MKLFVHVTLVLWFANQLVDGTCPKDYYIVVNNGTESCLSCHHCPHGLGLSPPCGSKVDYPSPARCVECVQGKTYSDDYGPSSCKNCHICSANEIVTRNCTASENTICSKTCIKGYYYDNITHHCQPCSDCCKKDYDIRIKECQSMLPSKQCSIHSAQQCKPKPTTTGGRVTHHYHTTTGTTPSVSASKKLNTGLIAACVVGGLFVGVILIILLIFLYKRRKKSRRRNIHATAAYNHRGDPDAERHLLSEADQCNLNRLELSVTNDSPNLLSEGQKISLTIIINCDVQNDNNNRKCNFDFEWKKDGLSMPNDYPRYHSKNLIVENVNVADSGQYYCEIQCNKHGHKEHPCTSDTVRIHVMPHEGRELKLFTNLDYDTKTRIANCLKPETVGVGNWKNLGRKFGIDEDELKALDEEKGPKEVLQHITCTCPDLTVFGFWEIMKSMNQNKIAKFLEDQLTYKPKEPTKSGIEVVTRPDSGIEEEFDLEVPLRVNLPPEPAASSKPSQLTIPAYKNLALADSSREASRESSLEDLRKPMEDKGSRSGLKRILRRKKSGGSQSISDRNDESEDDKDQDEKPNTGKTTRYGRQISKESQKSDDGFSGTRERKRSRSSSIANSIKEFKEGILKQQPSVEYSPLDHHHESDEGGLESC